ncbi:rhomboid family intramembrane serine protease [Akkermansiaceae bacterium]|nr:rhomboid family intramembrane serine protease [Akkermansiaceae bacterium]
MALYLYQISNLAFTSGWSVIPLEIISVTDLVGSSTLNTQQGPVDILQTPGPSPIFLILLSSMFMHGSWMHLGGNMLYLWNFGNNVELRFEHLKCIICYLGGGLAASAMQIATNTQGVIPNLGASGAIAGVLGSYPVLFPWNKVNAVFLVRIISVPAIVVLGMWGVMLFVRGV